MTNMTTPPPEGPPPGWVDPRAQQPPQAPYGMPPQAPPQFGFQQPYQQPGPHPTNWWFDGHKWREPVGQGPTKMQLAAQVPGMLIKLIVLLVFLGIIAAALGIIK